MSFVFFVVNSPCAHATALLVCSGPDGVVVSADSRGASLKGEVEAYEKLQLVGERTVVAEAGLLTIRDGHGPVFDVHQFVAEATRRLPPNAPAVEVAHALAQAAKKKLAPLVRHPSVARAPHPQLVLLVVGLDGDAPTVIRILCELRPLSVVESPREGPMVEVGLGPGHLDPAGVLFDFVKRRRPELTEPKTLEARVDLCGLMLEIESQLNPTVAPPILQVILRPTGLPERKTYSSPAEPRR